MNNLSTHHDALIAIADCDSTIRPTVDQPARDRIFARFDSLLR